MIRSIDDFSADELESFFAAVRQALQAGAQTTAGAESARGLLLLTLFLQPSTRTRASFTSAFLRMGGNCLCFDSLERDLMSSENPESLFDSGRFLSRHCDIIVTRAPSHQSFEALAAGSDVPVISAGHGTVEHPTTALNHLSIIKECYGTLRDRKVLLAAKLPKRTSHSLVKGLLRYPGLELAILSPTKPADLGDWNGRATARQSSIIWCSSYDELCDTTDLEAIEIVVMDEGRGDYLDGSPPPFLLDQETRDLFSPQVRFIHLKPILRMVNPEMKSDILRDSADASSRSTLMRSAVLASLLSLDNVE